MSSLLSVGKARAYGKTISAAFINCLIISSSFVLFSPKFNLDSHPGAALVLVISYPLVVSICTGIMTGTIAQTKNLASWKWGGVASVMTLFLIIMVATLPSLVSTMAFLIAPAVAIAISFNLMITSEANTQS
jgi:hypothetical protein